MVEPVPRLRVVGEGEPPPRGRRGPGIAVILVLLYALAFLGALLLLWTQVRRRAAVPSPPAAATRLLSAADRRALASGEGLAPAARADYERALSAALCDCGCGRKLSACLLGDQKCSRSPELADKLRQKFR